MCPWSWATSVKDHWMPKEIKAQRLRSAALDPFGQVEIK